MKLSRWGLCAVLLACISVTLSAVVWLGKNVFETYSTRDAEIAAARVIELTHTWETAIFHDWSNCIERLNTISPKDFSESSVRAITEKTRFRFPARIEEKASSDAPESADNKFSVLRENGFYILQRKTRQHGIQRIVFEENALFESIGRHAAQTISRLENASLSLVSVPAERGFGIVRELPGAKLEIKLGARKHADSVAAKHAVWLAAFGICVMLGAIFFLAMRVFSLSEKRYLFASAVSHELKTPLAELRACAETAIELSRENAVRKELATIDRSSRELSAIVENLLIFSRMKNGNLHFSLTEFTVEDVFSRIFDRIAERLISVDADAFFEIAPSVRERRLQTSVEMLGRILFNLADNAAKYGCRDLEENTVTFRVHANANKLCIDVEDKGFGIPEKFRSRIFRAFERGNAKHEARGLGLGLTISEQSAKLLGGKLILLKSDRTGTTFRLELPLLNF